MSLGDQTHSTKCFQEINPDLFPNMYTAERSFSAMKRLKNCLYSTTTTERMSGLALMHVHKDTELDILIASFTRRTRMKARVVTKSMLQTIQALEYHTYTLYIIILS